MDKSYIFKQKSKRIPNIKKYLSKTLVVYITIIFMMGTVLPSVRSDPNDPWWDTNWMYRKEINIDHTKVDANLKNFPVIINLSSDADLAAHAQPDGDDIVFTDAQGIKLNHEIELYTSATGRLVAWVNVTSLSSTTDTKLYLYYGNALCSSQQNQQGTWNTDYLMVHHMNGTGNIFDSTSHGYTGTNYGTTAEPNGKIDGSRYFDSTTDRYDFGAASSLNPGLTSWTISLWTKTSYVNGVNILQKYGSNAGFYLKMYNNGAGGYNYFYLSDGTRNTYRYWDASGTDGNWHYLTIVINRITNTLNVYLDGILHNGPSAGSLANLGSITTTSNFNFYGGTSARHDEFTISTIVRNISWIKTSYNNQNSPAGFYSLGSQEQAPSGNQPPVYGTPAPVNASVNNPISLTWSIPINDPEGNLFSWTIQCSNGQITSGAGATNGTKSLTLSGLAYSTTYKVWVNATDPTGSGLYTRRWFTFTTKQANSPPVFGTPSPANGSTGNLLSLTWSIPISDLDGDSFNWVIQCSNGQSANANGASNGTKSLTLSGLAYSTTYKVWVNATDPTGSGLYTRRWFTFTTKQANSPPVFGTPSPANGSTGNLLSLTWSIPISDPEGDLFSWTIQCSNGQITSGASATNGTKSLALSGLAYSTTYKVWVNATDPTGSGLYTRRWFTFTTKQANSPPVFGSPSPTNGSTGNLLSLTWSIPINDPEGNQFSWTIQCSNGQITSGAGATNGTKSLTLSGLAYSTTYKVWVNATDPTGSGLYTRKWYTFTTQAAASSWWNTAWNYRKLLTIDTTKISGTLVNFPILVQLTDSDLASHAQSTGNDILFVLYSDNTTKLNHQIEYYSSATGALYAWVNITRLSSSTNTKIWMYYGNAGSGSQQNKYGTWNSKYKAVYHLDENGPPYADSTSNKNNITTANVNGSGMAQAGGIYKWQHFNGTSNRFVIPFSLSGAYTLEAIANTDSVASSEVLIGYGSTTTSPYPGVAMGISAASNAIFVGTGTNPKALSPTATYVTTKTTHWWSDVHASSTSLLFYLDGINYTSSLSNVNFFNDADGYYTIGARYSSGYSLFWKGCIDEVRISSGTWNASWMKTCYNNQNNPTSFYSLSGQEQAPSGNQPPVFGTPTPVNGSTNNLLSLTWSIPINDPEGNLFSWTIQCNNGQTNSGTGASNGTKTLALSGLAYSTTYKVWVNATDPTGSGLYTRRWFTFTTKQANSPPVFGTPSPTNGSTGSLLSLTWSIPISDPEGDLFSWTIQCNNGQTNSGAGASNGTKSLTLSGLAYSTTYKVWVNATDLTGSGLYTRRWFTFTTKQANSPPVFGSPSPANGSTGNLLSLTWSIPINDPEGNTFSWAIQCNNGQTNSGSGATNGTKTLTLSGLAYSTTYKVWVNATDPTGSNNYTRKWYTITTKANLPPVFGTPTPSNGSISQPLSLTWSIPISDPEGNTFTWTIQCSNGQVSSGTGASNGTKSLALSGLAYLTAYKVWVNATDPTGSGLYTRKWYTFTTQAAPVNNPPITFNPNPVNGSNGIPISRTSINVTIQDPEGNHFNWIIRGQYVVTASQTDDSNETKTASLITPLPVNAIIVWYVNVTDPSGSGKWTNATYHFTTKSIIPTLKWSKTAVVGVSEVGPLAADINNDGWMEIVRSGGNGIVAYNGTTGNVIWNKPMTMWDNHCPMEIIDLNKDGILEIICSYQTGTMALHGNDGSVYWYNPNAPLADKYSVAGDINADGYPEVFVCMVGSVTALTHDGQIFASIYTYWPCWGGLSLGDTNHDGVFELYLCERGTNYDPLARGVRAFWASNLTERWHYDFTASSHCPTLIDVNNDGIQEVVALRQAYTGGSIYVFNSSDGKILRTITNYFMGTHSQPTIYDIDGDGNLELMTCRELSEAGVGIWDLSTGQLETHLQINNTWILCNEPPAIADIDADGFVEILACTMQNISIFNHNYQFIGSIPLADTGVAGMAMMVAQDIDKDGLLELVLNRNNQIYVYNTIGAAPTPRALSQFTHYSQLRGRFPYYNPYGPLAPIVKNEAPVNGSTYQPSNPTLSIYAYDYQYDLMNITFKTNASTGIWHTLKSVVNVNGGTYSTTTTEMNTPGVTYSWSVTVNDSTGKSTFKVYKFTTKGFQLITNPTPADGVTGVERNPVLSVHVEDVHGNPMNIIFKTNASGSWQVIGSNNSVGNGTYQQKPTTMNTYNTKYYWSIHCTDGTHWTNLTFSFTTYTPSSAPWWNPAWMYRKEIIIDHTKVDANLKNFPVLISLSTDLSLAAHTQPDGDDIVFTDAQGIKLNHEIELYTSATGRLVAWVNVTSLSSTTDTKLYLYYGNGLCSSQQNPQGTWNADYLMVHHMNETGNIIDSTSHALNAVNYGTATEPNGKIDGSRYFDSTADRYDFGTSSSLNPGLSSWTISLWTKTSYVNGVNILQKYGSNAGFYLKMYNNGVAGYNYVYLSDGTRNTYRYWDASGTDGNWHYLTIVINRNTNTLNVYLDGILHNGISAGSLANLGSITTTSNFNIYGGTNGRHDEFTISTAVRNDSWIKTSYNSQNNPASFYQIYPEQPLPPLPPSVTNPQPIDGATNILLHPTIRITVSHNYSYLMNIIWKTNASGTWAVIGTNSSVNNGIYSCSNTASASQYHKKYWWRVEVNDGHGNWNNKTYAFTTLTVPPTQGTPLLISEYGTNTTYENLICSNQSTVDLNELAVSNTYRWLRNSNSLTNLLLSFNTENQTNVKDYSGYNNNGTIVGATWTPNGVIGGAYIFSGADSQDRISIPHSSTLDGGGAWTGMTIEHWIYLMDDQTNSRTISKMASSGNSRSYQIGFQSANPNRLLAGVYIGSDSYKEVAYDTPLLTGQWYHIALTYTSGIGVKLYVNGVVVATIAGTGNIQASAGNNLYLGCLYGTQSFFDGKIDEVKIYSFALSAEQIYQNYLQSKDGLSSHSTIVPEETTTGDIWQCTITPSNGIFDGSTNASNALTVLSGYSLTTNTVSDGIITRNPDKKGYVNGEVVQLTAVPAPDSTFDYWSGDLTGSTNPLDITMNSNKSVTAHFISPPHNDIIFNSSFDNGNLINVQYQSGNYSGSRFYTATVNYSTASGMVDKHWWFYFSMANVTGKTVKIQLQNLLAADFTGNRWNEIEPVYSYDNINWERLPLSNVVANSTGLTFTMTVTPTQNKIWLAPIPPYPIGKRDALFAEFASSPYLTVSSLGTTPGGQPLKVATITDPSYSDVNKFKAYVIAQQHAGEVPGSWNAEGMIRFLLSDNSTAQAIRRSYIFRIVPIVNVDGVYYGRSRYTPFRSGTQYDLNREWSKAVGSMQPEVQWIFQDMQTWQPDSFNDLHSTINTEMRSPKEALTYTWNYLNTTVDNFMDKIALGGYPDTVRGNTGSTYACAQVKTRLGILESISWENPHDELSTNPGQKLTVNDWMNWGKAYAKGVYLYFGDAHATLTVTTVGSGSISKNPDQQTYHYGDNVILTATPESGWVFSHWTGDLSGSINPVSITMTGNKTITAHFVVSGGYTITIPIVGSGSVIKNPDLPTYDYGQVVTLTANPAVDWAFSHWTGDVTGSTNPTVITMNSSKTVTAHFTQGQYILSIAIDGQGAVAKNPDYATYIYGDVVQLTANPALGWSFTGWSGDLIGNTNPASITMTSNKTVTATFTQDHYLLTTSINGQGSIIKTPDQPTYTYGTVVTLAATPTLGWAFTEWSGDLSGSTNPTTITMTSNKAVIASFTQSHYTLTMNHIGNGSINKNPDQTTYHYNDPVTLTAIADPSWSFTGWSGDLTGTTNPASITITSNNTITAHFSQIVGIENWRYRSMITLNKQPSLDQPEKLIDFPVLVDIIDPNLAAKAQPDGDDILFTDLFRTKLAHEIEYFNSTSGHLVAWVKIPELFSDQEINISMYYGNMNAGNQQNPTGVWGSNYALVQHLEETTGNVSDSTTYNHWGIPNGGLQQNVTGIIDGADQFDGSNDYLDLGTTTDFDRKNLTISAWVKSAVTTTDMRIVVSGAAYTNKWHLIMDDGYLMVTNDTVANANLRTTSLFSDNQWHYVVGIRNPLRLYVDGGWISAAPIGESWSLDGNSKIGAKSASQYFFNGKIDEVRISPGVHSAQWIKTEYNNQHNPANFTVVGAEEDMSGLSISNECPMNGATNIPLSPILHATVNHTKGFSMNITWSTNATGSWTTISTNSSVHNGTYSCSNTATMNAYNTRYYWKIAVNDGYGHQINKTSSFSTRTGPYALTINMIGTGSGTVEYQPSGPYYYGDVVTLWANASTQSTFTEWSGDLSGSASPNSLTMTGNKIVTAQFTLRNYTLTINKNGNGTVTKTPNQLSYPYGTDVVITASADPGWSFSEWSGDVTGSTNPVTLPITSNKTVTATFTQNHYTLSVSATGNGVVSKTPDQPTYHYGDSVLLTATADPEWTFSHWSGDLSGSVNPASITMNGDKTITANFAQGLCTLTVTIVGQGTVAKNPDYASYPYGQVVQLTANPTLGWSFDHWSGDLNGNTNPTSITMNGNKAVTATFTQNQYTLAITTSGQGTVSKNPNLGTYIHGQVVQLTANPAADWSFSHWSGNLTGTTNPASITMTGNKIVTAHFTQVFNIDNWNFRKTITVNKQPYEDNCRLYAILSNNLPNGILYNDLISAPKSIEHLSDVTNIDGWGIGYYPQYGGSAIIERGKLKAIDDPVYDVVVSEINTSEPKITLAHIRNCVNGCCSHGTYTIDDPHPFVRTKNGKTWTFIHNGAIHESIVLPLIGEDYLNENPMNCSCVCSDDQHCDSEIYFLLLLKHIENNSWNVINGVTDAIKELYNHGEYGGLNFVLSDGQKMWAFRRHSLSTHTLYYLYDAVNGISEVASDYPSVAQGNWISMNDYELVELSNYQAPVIVDNVLGYTPLSPLVDFPVLIDIVDSDLALKAQSNGNDILFTDVDFTKLDHEIESFNSTTGHLVAWVRMPSLFMNQEESIYMYYGNMNAQNQQNLSGVWNSHYMVVQHLEETSGTVSDSTINHNNGVPQNGVTLDASGKIDGADAFDGTDDYISIPDHPTLDGDGTWSEMTMEAWIKADTSQNARIIIAKWGAASSRSYEIGIDSNGNTQPFAGIDNGAYLETLYSDATSLTPGTWYYVTATYKAGVLNLYINGILDATKSNTGGNIKASSDSLKIGARNPTVERFFDGCIDEVKISNLARSSNWTLLSYLNQNDTSKFIGVGPEEGQKILLLNEYPENDATAVPLAPILEISVYQMNGYLMNITWKAYVSGSWTVLGTNTSVANNTFYCSNTGLINSYNTLYYWRVEVNDGHGHWNNQTYSFTTLSPSQEYTLAITKVGNGAVAIDPDQPTYHLNDVVQLTATPDPGWSFTEWSGDYSCSCNPANITITHNMSVTATFTQDEYILTITPFGSGGVTKNPDQSTYHYGDVVQLTAIPVAGWSFTSWSGDLGGSTNPATITMTSNKAVTATFTQNEYTLAITLVGSGSVAKAPDQSTYHYNDVVQLTATADTGWVFSAWSGDLIGSTNPASLTIDGNKAITATFTQNALLVDPTFDASADNTELRTNSAGQDWYESRGGFSNGDATLLTLDTNNFGGNTGKKAGLKSYGSSTAHNAYCTQEFVTPQTGTFTVSFDIYIDRIEDAGDYDRTGNIFIGDDSAPANAPTGTSNERFVLLAFYDPTPGDTGTDLEIRARTTTGQNFAITSQWTQVASGLSYDTWYAMKFQVKVASGTYDVYVNDVLKMANVPKYPGYTSTSVVYMTFDADGDGRGDYYVDNVFAPSVQRYTLHTATTGSGSIAITPGESTYAYGAAVQLTAVPTIGWSFDHWSGDLSGSTNPATITMDGNKSVTALFTQNEYTLTITPTGSGSVIKVPDQSTYHYDDVVQLTATADPGWTFSHWTGDLTGSTNPASLTINDNMNVQAVFTQNEYTLTTSTTGSGSVAKAPDQSTYHYNDVVQLTATSDPGWTFSHWTGDLTGSTNPASLTIIDSMNVQATFTQNDYTLTITPIGLGTVTKNPDQVTYPYNTEVTLTATPDIGWSFTGWGGDLGGSTNPTTITMTSNKAVTATFLQNEYTLTITLVGSGSVAKVPDQSTYHYGDVVQLTATPNTGWAFSAWSGDLTSSTNPASITIDGNKAVTATFTQLNLLVDPTFDTSADSIELRTNSAGQDWYESRGIFSNGDPLLLTLDTNNIGGNIGKKAGLKSYGSSTTHNAYCSQEFLTPQTGTFTVSFDIFIDRIEDAGDYDRTGHIFIGDDSAPANAPTGTSNERFVFLAFYDSTPGDTGNDLEIRARTSSSQAFATTSQWLQVASGLSYDTWYTVKLNVKVASSQYDVYINDVLKMANIAKYSGYGTTSVVYMTFDADGDGRGDYYIDNVFAPAVQRYTLHTATTGSGSVTISPGESTYAYGAVVQLTAVPAIGWSFDHWSSDLSGSTNPASITMDSNKTVSAVFTQNEYTLTITPTGSGSVIKVPDQSTYHYGDVVQLTATADPGWTFTSWTGDLTGSTNPDSLTIIGNMNVEAVFTQNEYTLAITPVGSGSVTKAPDHSTYHYDDVVELAATSVEGWSFTSWSGDLTGFINPASLTITKDMSVTATFTQDEYTLTITPVGSGSVAKVPDQSTYHYNDVVQLTATADLGWIFTSWTGDLTGSTNPASLIITKDMSVTATFTQNEYTLTITLVGSGSVAKVPDQSTYHYNDVVQLTASADLGWTFAGWSGDLAGSTNPETITIDGNKAVTATFTQNEYTLTVTTVGSGSVAKNPDQVIYHYGDVVQLTASAVLGWTFSHWSGDLSGSVNPVSITMLGNRAVTATFTQNEYTLTITTVGSGSVTKLPDQTTYHYGDSVQLTANADIGWSFSQWSGDLSGSLNPASITIDGNKVVTATFTQNEYTLTITTVGSGSVVKVPDQTTYHYEDVVQLTATPNIGWAFSAWSGDLIGNTNPTTITIDSNKAVTATFTQMNLLVDPMFDASVDSADLRTNTAGQDWYESRGGFSNGDPLLLTLDTNSIGGNSGKKAGLKSYGSSTAHNAYCTQEFVTPQTGTFTVSFDIYIDRIENTGTYDRTGHIYIGDDRVTTNAPTGTGGERFVCLAFYDPTPGDSGNDLEIRAKTLNAQAWTTTSQWIQVASGLNYDTWMTMKLVVNPAGGTYDVYVDGVLKMANIPKHDTYTPTSVVYMTFVADGDGRGDYYVDNVFAPSVQRYTLHATTQGSGSVTITPGESTYANGAVVQLTAVPAIGWTFTSWSGDLSGSTNPATITMDGNKAVTAIFTQNEYTLTITPTGSGSVTKNPDQSTYHYGDVVELIATADLGWTFTSWTGDLTGSTNPGSLTITGNMNVGALFIENEYTLTITPAGGGSVTKAPDQSTYHYNDAVQITAIADAGWTFSHWTGDLTGSMNPGSLTINGNMNVEAIFTQNEYTVTIIPVGSGSVTKNPDQSIYHYNDVVQLTANAALGWSFTSWSGDITGSTNPASLTITKDMSVTATFTQNEYTLTITLVGSGSVAKAPDQSTYHYSDVVELTATPDSDWTFSFWTGDLTGNTNPTSLTITGNMNVQATFTQNDYTLTITPIGLGTVTKNPDQVTYPYNTEVTLTATADIGWSFTSWSGDLGGSTNPTTITMTSNKAVTATFSQNEYTLTITLVGSGSVAKVPDQSTYHYGDVVQLTATANTGWVFSAWSGDLTGSTNPDSITMTGNKAVTATFTQSALLVDPMFDISADSIELRANSTSQDWYESRGGFSNGDPLLLTLDTTDIGGNMGKKAGLKSFGSTNTHNAYCTQEFLTPQTGTFTVSFDLYIDRIEDSAAYDRTAHIYIGDNRMSADAPTGTSNERFVFLAFYDPTPGDTGTDIEIRARTLSSQVFATTSQWVQVTSGLSYDTWMTMKLVVKVASGTYDVYIDGVLKMADIPKYAGYTPTVMSVKYMTFVADGDGRGDYYVDNVYSPAIN